VLPSLYDDRTRMNMPQRTRTLVRSLAALLAIGVAACGPTDAPEADASRSASAPTPITLTLGAPIAHLDSLAREPMVVVHPSGALFVSGYRAGRRTVTS
jgi:hypothetical protein